MMLQKVIGLEIHVELKTETKMFCACPSRFGGAPNTRVCPVCLGHPGSLPAVNKKAVEYSLSAACALGCEISPVTVFERKNYFYPDLPKGYQISALRHPLARGGGLDTPDGFVRIHEIHMEEDAGKLVHEGGHTLLDFNRCGVPLIEIVTEPDIRSAKQATDFLSSLKSRFEYLGISDMKIQEGSMRVDVNISVREDGAPLGNRCELKNLSSFRSVERAIEYEAQRQSEILAAGETVEVQTRRFDESGGKTVFMRKKEEAGEYRYYPEPNIPPLRFSKDEVERIKSALPEFAEQKAERYQKEYMLSQADAQIIASSPFLAEIFEKSTAKGAPAKEVRFLLVGEALCHAGKRGKAPEELGISPDKVAFIASALAEGSINRAAAKEVFEKSLDGSDPDEYIKEHSLAQIGDSAQIESAARSVIAENPDMLAQYRAGKTKVFAAFVGKTMGALGGRADPGVVRDTLSKLLEND